jgi:hypothetical protein
MRVLGAKSQRVAMPRCQFAPGRHQDDGVQDGQSAALSSNSRSLSGAISSGVFDIMRQLDHISGVLGVRSRIAMLVFFVCLAQMLEFAWGAEGQKFRADEWLTECGSGAGSDTADCSITVPFWQTHGNPRGSFALVVMLQTGNIGIVGQPSPVRAVLRVDKNPPIECSQPRYCVFPSIQAPAVLKQLKAGSLILVDVYTEKGAFNFSLTPKGYQAGLAQIRAWGYRTD